MSVVRWGLRLAAACLLVPVLAFAQATTADIVGRVTDSSGSVLPGATVTITNEGTGDVRVATTTESGDYVFNLLPIGTYGVKVELQGFGVQNTRVVLSTGDRARFDARLTVGQVTENVTVTAEAPLLQTDTSTLAALVTEKAVQDLPVNGRNVTNLVQLVPGANEGLPNSLASGTRPDDRRSTSAISINGAPDNQNNQMIDGMDNNERAIGTIGVKPSIDAIAEVKVQTNMYTADVGRTAGGVVNVITKSGTNSFRGSAFEFYRNDRFDERNYFSLTKPLLTQNQFGGSLGGPLKSDRTFFFADYEGFRHRSGVTNVITVPTVKMRSGDFSEITQQIYDPLSSPRVAFPGNQIPLNRLDPISLKYIALYPQPTSAGIANNYSSTTERTQESSTADFRIDHRFNGSNSIFFRYSVNMIDTFTPSACPATADGIEPGCGGGPGFPGPNETKAHGTQVNYVRVFNPTLLGEFRGGYLISDIQSLPLNYQSKLGNTFGIPGVNFDDFTNGLPLMSITGFSALGDATFIPLIQVDKTKQFSATITKTTGAHNLKIGGGVIMRQFRVFQSASPVGNFTFDATVTNNGTGTGGNAMATFLLGFPTNVTRSHSLVDPRYHTNEPSIFVQDDWRATDWLTLNLGVRYDVFTPFTEETNGISNFDRENARIIQAGVNGVSDTAGVKTDYGNIAPRLGFSASLPAQMVLRGGYGLAYFPGNMQSGAFLKNPPFISAYGPVISAANTGGVANIRLSDGLPLPVATPTDPALLGGALIATDPDLKVSRVQQFNLTFEKEFAGNVAGVGYVGSRGDRIVASPNINLAPVGTTAPQPRRPFASRIPNVTNIAWLTSGYESEYNALQLVFQRRFRDGLSFNTNYTLAKNEDTGPAPWDPNVTLRSVAGNDVRHRVVVTANYQLPGQGLGGVSGALLGGWQVNLIAQYQTGLPYQISNAAARANTGGNDWPNQVIEGDPTLDEPIINRNAAGQVTSITWFNTAAFAAQPVGTVGNVTRNSLHGPSQRRVDFSLFRDVTITATSRLQLRWEVYNLFNTVNFDRPNGALGNAAFGTITGTANAIPRQMQFAAKFLF